MKVGMRTGMGIKMMMGTMTMLDMETNRMMQMVIQCLDLNGKIWGKMRNIMGELGASDNPKENKWGDAMDSYCSNTECQHTAWILPEESHTAPPH